MEVKELKKILTERQDFITPSAFTEKYGIKFSHHDGKMAGFDSLSTSCKENPFCQRNMAIAGSICEDCFSDDLLNCRKSLSKVLENNYNILTTLEIPVEEWPLIWPCLELNRSVTCLTRFKLRTICILLCAILTHILHGGQRVRTLSCKLWKKKDMMLKRRNVRKIVPSLFLVS